jgi:hypothetical protein
VGSTATPSAGRSTSGFVMAHGAARVTPQRIRIGMIEVTRARRDEPDSYLLSTLSS